MGFKPSFMVSSRSSLPGPCQAPLLEFLSPSAFKEERVHGRDVHRDAPVIPVDVGGSHAVDYGAARRFSQPHSDLFLSRPSCHSQAGDALGVLPFRGFLLLRRPDDSSPPACLLDVLRSVAHARFPGVGSDRRTYRTWDDPVGFLVVFEASVHGGISPRHESPVSLS